MSEIDPRDALLFRIDERVTMIGCEVLYIKDFLSNKVMTKAECEITRKIPKPLAVVKELTVILTVLALVWSHFQGGM